MPRANAKITLYISTGILGMCLLNPIPVEAATSHPLHCTADRNGDFIMVYVSYVSHAEAQIAPLTQGTKVFYRVLGTKPGTPIFSPTFSTSGPPLLWFNHFKAPGTLNVQPDGWNGEHAFVKGGLVWGCEAYYYK